MEDLAVGCMVLILALAFIILLGIVMPWQLFATGDTGWAVAWILLEVILLLFSLVKWEKVNAKLRWIDEDVKIDTILVTTLLAIIIVVKFTVIPK